MLLGALALSLRISAGLQEGGRAGDPGDGAGRASRAGADRRAIAADAVLAPLAQAAIAPKISAPVRKFYVQRGARVKEGQLLATLENSDLAAAALDNKGSYMAAEAAYATATKAQVPEDTQKAELGRGAGQGQSRSESEHREEPQAALCRRRNSGTRSGYGQGRAGAGAGRVRRGGQASGVDAQREPRSRAEVGAGAVDLGGGQVQGRGGPGELLRDSQPHQRRGDRPAAVCRRNRGCGHAAAHGDGHLKPAGQDAHGAEPGAAE